MTIKNAMPHPISIEIQGGGKIHLGAAPYDDRILYTEEGVRSNTIYSRTKNGSGKVRFRETLINFTHIPDPEPDTIFIVPAKVVPELLKLGRRDFWSVDKSNAEFAEGLKQLLE